MAPGKTRASTGSERNPMREHAPPECPEMREATKAAAVVARREQQASGKRRRIDPTTFNREYSSDELEFMLAMHEYKVQRVRPFPTWSEVLEVLTGLGYRKVADDGRGACGGLVPRPLGNDPVLEERERRASGGGDDGGGPAVRPADVA